ncbi:MAG: hypothetical protein Q8R44_10615 [Novosphingobium sp.]|nr:hypothetical protein [Novosphingobium sp.]
MLLAVAIVAVAVAALAAWFFLLQGRGAQLDLYKRDAAARMQAAKPKQVTAETFRATICAASPCVLIEAGGLAFLVGAGEGAGEGLLARGLMRADLDAILVNDLSLASVEGLPRLQQLSFALQRSEPTPVFGPDGLLTVVDGANLLLSGAGEQGARLQVGLEGEDQGLAGKVVFDSGVVAIRAFAAARGGRVYRIDAGEKSLIVAGCTARGEDVLAAARGAKTAAAIIAAEASQMLEIEDRAAAAAGGVVRMSKPTCMGPDEALKAVAEARLTGVLLAPLEPAGTDSQGRRAWEELVVPPPGIAAGPGQPGAVLDMSGKKPALVRGKP